MEIKPIVYLFSLAGTRLHLWRLHLQSHLVVAANLAGTVDDTLRQGWPVQSVFSAAEPRCTSIMGVCNHWIRQGWFQFCWRQLASCPSYHVLSCSHLTHHKELSVWMKNIYDDKIFLFPPPFIEWNQEAVKWLFFIKKKREIDSSMN